jgi:hypothetical protein
MGQETLGVLTEIIEAACLNAPALPLERSGSVRLGLRTIVRGRGLRDSIERKYN